MSIRSRAASTALRGVSRTSQTVELTSLIRDRKKQSEAMHKLIWIEVERELELTVLYAVGDADGPLSGEVKIGISGRKAFEEEMRAIRGYRSRDIARHIEVVIRGKGRAAMVKSAVEQYLRTRDRHIRAAWWRAEADDLAAQCDSIARALSIPLMSHDEAVLLEHTTFDERAAKYFTGAR